MYVNYSTYLRLLLGHPVHLGSGGEDDNVDATPGPHRRRAQAEVHGIQATNQISAVKISYKRQPIRFRLLDFI